VTLAHDGDADRCVAVDDTGEYIGLDRQLAMVTDYLMQGSRNKTVISTVESGLTLREVVEKNNGKLLISKVGSGTLGRLVKQKQALFGGEPCGEYIFPELHHGADGIASALLLVEMDAEEKLSSRKKKYKAYPIKRGKFSLATAKKSKQEVMEQLKAELPADGELNETDGIRMDTENAFVLVRPSGTENVVRLTCEARNDKVLADLYLKFSKAIESAIK
jgi:phosphoglucosamine mutase